MAYDTSWEDQFAPECSDSEENGATGSLVERVNRPKPR